MSMTPEGRVKKAVKTVLNKFKPELDDFWPVPSGYGESHLDCIVCYRGKFIAIETKAPDKSPTPLQIQRLNRVLRAGGYAMVVGGKMQTHGIEELEAFFNFLKVVTEPVQQDGSFADVPRKRKTQGRGRARHPNTARDVL